jgi:hypothetical protein
LTVHRNLGQAIAAMDFYAIPTSIFIVTTALHEQQEQNVWPPDGAFEL